MIPTSRAASSMHADWTVSVIGAAAFLLFGLLYAVEAYHTPSDARSGDDVDW